MTLAAQLKAATANALRELFPDLNADASQITVNQTKPEFNGHYTVVLFPFVKALRAKPAELGKKIGDFLVAHTPLFNAYEIVGGFLNLSVSESYWPEFLLNHFNDTLYGEAPKHDYRVMVEYSSPNTNKPLHFGHLRNNFLGFSVSNILKSQGQQVVMANLVNDRGIHICKSMVAWKRLSNGATPESTGTKGDHLVGEYYVRFSDELKVESARIRAAAESGDFSAFSAAKAEKWQALMAKLAEPEIAANEEKAAKLRDELKDIADSLAPCMLEAQDMLRDWEANDPDVRALWSEMNGWVYKGFDETYHRLGIRFDKYYYESDTYLLGKQIVEEGLQRGILFKKDDGSVWIDLTADGLDQKLLLRGDGTSVYMTQDLGTAKLKQDDYKLNKSLYVIADEQNYHMQVLKLILEKLDEPAAPGIHHLSYGMVTLPQGMGKMKSREGTAVDADDMVDDMIAMAKEQTEAAGKTEGFTQTELTQLYEMIGLGAVKFYLLRVDPKKTLIFNPKESIDLHGYTATFIQYAHARICSILRKEGLTLLPDRTHFQQFKMEEALTKGESNLLLLLEQYPTVTASAADEFSPSVICAYAFNIAQAFNSFYDDNSITRAESEEKKSLRLMIIIMTAQVLRHSMKLLGITLPERM
jgi:arginyl-tRNA synthetase